MGGGLEEHGLLGKGNGAASPALADGLRLHLDSEELPRTILEHVGVDLVLDETPPLSDLSLLEAAGIKELGDLLRNHPTCPCSHSSAGQA